MFTIEVKKKEKDKKFSFKDLEMFHQECCSGQIKLEVTRARANCFSEIPVELYELTCARCGERVWLKKQSRGLSKIIRTAIDERKREINGV